MSTLVLVRHGQARAFSNAPDQLSPKGWQQAHTLGSYWVRQGERFDSVYHGSLRRQRETCEAVATEYAKDGKPFPVPIILPALNEYVTQDLVSEVAPRLAKRDREFEPLWEAWEAVVPGQGRNRTFQIMFEALVSRWVDGRLQEPGLEPWESFRLRAREALQTIRRAQGRGMRVAAFTSGGPIGVAVQSCLGAPAAAALAVNWRVRNTSLTTFLYSGSRLSLDGFNELPHLSLRPDLVTFR